MIYGVGATGLFSVPLLFDDYRIQKVGLDLFAHSAV